MYMLTIRLLCNTNITYLAGNNMLVCVWQQRPVLHSTSGMGAKAKRIPMNFDNGLSDWQQVGVVIWETAAFVSTTLRTAIRLRNKHKPI